MGIKNAYMDTLCGIVVEFRARYSVCCDVLCCDYGVLLFRLGVLIIRVSGTQTLNYMAKLVSLLPS